MPANSKLDTSCKLNISHNSSTKDHTEVADTPTSGIKESVSLQKKASDKLNWLGEANLTKEIIADNIVSLATQLSQNQSKIFPGKTKTQTSSIQAKLHFFKSSPASWVIVNNIVSLATQLSQNQNKIFPGKLKTQTLSMKKKSLGLSPPWLWTCLQHERERADMERTYINTDKAQRK